MGRDLLMQKPLKITSFLCYSNSGLTGFPLLRNLGRVWYRRIGKMGGKENLKMKGGIT